MPMSQLLILTSPNGEKVAIPVDRILVITQEGTGSQININAASIPTPVYVVVTESFEDVVTSYHYLRANPGASYAPHTSKEEA